MDSKSSLNQYLQQLKLLTYQLIRYKFERVSGETMLDSLYLTRDGKLAVRRQDTISDSLKWQLFKEPIAQNPQALVTLASGGYYNLNELQTGTYTAIASINDELTASNITLEIASEAEIGLTDSIQSIHDALLTFAGLSRSTLGSSFSYYMSGIAKVIRYLVENKDPSTDDSSELLAVLITKFNEWYNTCQHLSTTNYYENLDDSQHTRSIRCDLCDIEIDTYSETHSHDENGYCVCSHYSCPHKNCTENSYWVDSTTHRYIVHCTDCESDIEESYFDHAGSICQCGAVQCSNCGTYYETEEGVSNCSTKEGCDGYHTHEYEITSYTPDTDTTHIVTYTCKFDGASYTITENCILNEECPCGRIIYTCGCNSVDSHQCNNIVSAEGLLCDSCARDCTQIKDDEQQATYCQHCGSILHNSDQCPIETWVCGCYCSCTNTVYDPDAICDSCSGGGHQDGCKPGLTHSICSCCGVDMYGPEASQFCEDCVTAGCTNDTCNCGNHNCTEDTKASRYDQVGSGYHEYVEYCKICGNILNSTTAEECEGNPCEYCGYVPPVISICNCCQAEIIGPEATAYCDTCTKMDCMNNWNNCGNGICDHPTYTVSSYDYMGENAEYYGDYHRVTSTCTKCEESTEAYESCDTLGSNGGCSKCYHGTDDPSLTLTECYCPACTAEAYVGAVYLCPTCESAGCTASEAKCNSSGEWTCHCGTSAISTGDPCPNCGCTQYEQGNCGSYSYTCYCAECECSKSVSEEYMMCDDCLNGKHSHGPEATTCDICGGDHKTEDCTEPQEWTCHCGVSALGLNETCSCGCTRDQNPSSNCTSGGNGGTGGNDWDHSELCSCSICNGGCGNYLEGGGVCYNCSIGRCYE